MSIPSFTHVAARFSAFALTAGCVVGLWLLGLLGGFRVPDGFAYDYLVRLRASLEQDSSRVLLVEVEDPTLARDEETLLRMLEELGNLGARQILFALEVPGSFSAFHAEAERRTGVVLARGLARDSLDPERLKVVGGTLPGSAAGATVPWGILHGPPSTGGVSRRHFGHFLIDGTEYPTLEVEAATRALGKAPGGIADGYNVSFRGGVGSLPHVSAERLLGGELIPELVSGRSVLIGYQRALGEPGLCTPTTTGLETMSLLEYQGHALNTLMSGRMTRDLSGIPSLLLLCGVALLATLACTFLSVQINSWLTFGALGLYGALSFAAFAYQDTWLPLSQITACHLILFLVVLRRRAVDLTRAMRRLVSDASSQLRDKFWPGQLYQAKPSWSLVANMINQTLDLNKLIFLEADSNSSKLKEILALHCSLDDIVERRRDYNRAPYVDALKAKMPLRVKGYMTARNEEEVQFVAPLVFCGRLLGFWALGIDQTRMNGIQNFERLLRDYTDRISELLYHAFQARERDSSGAMGPAGFGVEKTGSTYKNLQG